MHPPSCATLRARAVLLWTGVSALGAGLVAAAGPLVRDLLRAPGGDFAEVFVRCCAAVAVVAATVIWAATTDVVLAVLRSPSPVGRRVGPLRAFLLTICGVAILGTAAPASATPPAGPEDPPGAADVAGLPLPDRTVGGPSGQQPPGAATVRVRAGDSLWSVADRALGPAATETEVAAYWRRLVALNRPVLGATPDIVHPGQRLDLPPR